MRILVTGSAGHLGEALVRTLRAADYDVVGLDILASPFTTHVGSIVDRVHVDRSLHGVDIVLHTATLHKPHVATHPRQAFVDVNVTGTLNLLEAATAAQVGAFVFTSTTSAFGEALAPPEGAPCAWVTEDVMPIPKNIYGVTKIAAEQLCELFHRREGLPCVVLRTSRFFPEPDDNPAVRSAYADANVRCNEFLYRRVDIADVVDAHVVAMQRAATIGFGQYIVSATTPFRRDDLQRLRIEAPSVVRRYVPEYAEEYARRGWAMFPSIERVYVNAKARRDLGWQPRFDFRHAIDCLARGIEPVSELARTIGSKGYHAARFDDGPYPVA
jgi:UDP-glucose 4-epimerase